MSAVVTPTRRPWSGRIRNWLKRCGLRVCIAKIRLDRLSYASAADSASKTGARYCESQALRNLEWCDLLLDEYRRRVRATWDY